MFSINCLEITATKSQWKENKSIYKNLLSDDDFASLTTDDTPVNKRFLFNDFYKEENGCLVPNTNRFLPDNFFGENINIQAIVGKNGSGKSTLMDLMYMAINNFAFMFERGKEFLAAHKLYWIKNLSVNVYFSVIHDSELFDSEYRLVSKENSVHLQIKYENDFVDIEDDSTGANGKFELNKENKQEGFALYNLLQDFFYTIVSNYSMQSFVLSNYKSNCFFYSKEDDKQKPKHFNTCNLDTITQLGYQYTEGTVSWIESIFHKNDGYTCPIVLNPKRDDRGVDIELEQSLAKYREIALLLWAQKNKKNFINGYDLQRIDFRFNKEYILQKMEKSSIDDVLRDIDNQISHPDEVIIYEPSFANWLMSIKNFNISQNSPKLARIALAYLIYKIKSIVKYPSYFKYSKKQEKSIFHKDNSNTSHTEENLRNLLEDIQKDKSHSVTKIKQTINFLQHDWLGDDSKATDINNWYSQKFDDVDYYKNYPLSSDNLDDIINSLPPPFFNYDIHLTKNLKSPLHSAPINIMELSSGEQQLIQTLSSHIYHIRNLESIIKSNKNQSPNNVRPEYRNINLVFDEMEICFHPEYQRQFVNHLTTTIKNMGLNKECSFNIFLITHSPFILSDIPKSNVLFMQTDEDKENIKKIPTHTFAQNIGDMMYSSFFMEKTIGEFAEEKLKELIKFKQGKNPSMLQSEADAILKSIGDPVIRSLIEEVGKHDGDEI